MLQPREKKNNSYVNKHQFNCWNRLMVVMRINIFMLIKLAQYIERKEREPGRWEKIKGECQRKDY